MIMNNFYLIKFISIGEPATVVGKFSEKRADYLATVVSSSSIIKGTEE